MNDYWLRTDIDKLKAKVERLEEKIKELKKDKDMNNLEDRSIQEMFESLDSFNLSTMEKRYIKSFIDEKAEQNKYLYEKAASETFKRLKLEKEIKELKKERGSRLNEKINSRRNKIKRILKEQVEISISKGCDSIDILSCYDMASLCWELGYLNQILTKEDLTNE